MQLYVKPTIVRPKLKSYYHEIFPDRETIDKKIIDGLGPIGFSSSIYLASKYIKQIQSGKLFNYATFMILGIVLFFILIFINF